MGSKLFALIVIVLGVVAIAQLVRLYELSSKLRKEGEHEVNSRDNNLNGRLMLGFMIFLFGGFIYLMKTYGWTGRGEAASIHGAQLDWLLNLNLVIIIAVFFLTNALLFIFSYKYLRKPGVKAYYFPHDNKMEMIWTVVPAIVLAVIIILGLKSWNDATGEASKEAERVELFSKQYDWTARYSGDDNQLGKYDYKLTTAANELALMTKETIDSAIREMESGSTGIDSISAKLNNPHVMLIPEEREKLVVDLERKERLIRLLYQMREHHNAADDRKVMDDIIQKDTLYLCVNKPYEFNFRSKDVIHSAYIPHFRVQMNTVPGTPTRFKFTPTITTMDMRDKVKNDQFNYVLMCNKICGNAHYKMKMMVVVLTEKEYDRWMKGKKQSATFKKSFFKAVAAATPPAAETVKSDSVVKTDSVAIPKK